VRPQTQAQGGKGEGEIGETAVKINKFYRLMHLIIKLADNVQLCGNFEVQFATDCCLLDDLNFLLTFCNERERERM